MLIDDDLLLPYIHGFYGYGNYEGRYWLIGMEEGVATARQPWPLD